MAGYVKALTRNEYLGIFTSGNSQPRLAPVPLLPPGDVYICLVVALSYYFDNLSRTIAAAALYIDMEQAKTFARAFKSLDAFKELVRTDSENSPSSRWINNDLRPTPPGTHPQWLSCHHENRIC